MTNRSLQSTVIAVTLFSAACGGAWTSSTAPAPPVPPAAPVAADADSSESVIRFLENKVKDNPEDFIAHNKLAGYYLQRLRETGSVTYIDLAFRAAHASLETVPADHNTGGLAALAQAELASHDFPSARDHARQLVEMEPNKAYPHQILGDALLELGAYDEASAAYRKSELLSFGPSIASETRLARVALLKGNTVEARERFTSALTLALDAVSQQRETIAWCRWQLGEIAFLSGDYAAAEQHYRDSLTTFENYHQGLAGLGKARAAQGDLAGAIELYERVTRIIPDPNFVAALGDLYRASGRQSDAEAQYGLVEQIGRLSALNGALYNRQLALFYADHDLKPDEACALAANEYVVRRDIYGADAVAWTAFKAGRLDEARSAIAEALKLGTKDPKLLYHAGMIARASGDPTKGRALIEQALALSPRFDLLQAPLAEAALNP